MKNTLKILFALTLLISACRPDPFKEIGPDYPLGDGITGTWSIKKMVQVDETAAIPEKIDVSDFYSTDPLVISFNHNDLSYVVNSPGAGVDLFGGSGSYAYTYELEFPTAITLFSALGDTLLMDLTQMPRSIDYEMGFNLSRMRCDAKNITYELKFDRQ
jgi:hypothetical protein